MDIGGKKRHVELIDENVNGTFNDRAADMGDCDCVAVEGDKVERALPGQAAGGGRAVLPDRGGPRRGVHQAAEGGERRAGQGAGAGEHLASSWPSARTAISCASRPRASSRCRSGKYRIQEWKIDRKDDKGAAWELSAYNFNDSARFEVAAGQAGVAGGRRADAGGDGDPGAEQPARCQRLEQTDRRSASASRAATARPCRS